MFSVLIMALLAQPVIFQNQDLDQGSQLSYFRELKLNSMDTGEPFMLIQVRSDLLDPPKKSPLQGWEFSHVAAGFARDSVAKDYNLRIQVYDQFDSGKSDMATRMLLRLWDLNNQRLNLDHARSYYRRTVQVYLAFGGEPGAEQKFMKDPELLDEWKNPVQVNNIYVYAITTIDDPLEFARELAHEYGHAILPPIGAGYKEPENWAIGDIGERIYLMWLLEGMKAGKIGPDDVMGASQAKMQAFYDKVTLPDLKRVATKGTDMERLEKMDKAAFDELLGLATYTASILPHKMFGRAIVLTSSSRPESFVTAIVEAASERPDWEVTVPQSLKGLAIWIPLQKGKVVGAKELRRKGDWVKIQPTSKNVRVVNEKQDKS